MVDEPYKRPGGKRSTPKPPPADRPAGPVSEAVAALVESLDLDGDLGRLALAALAANLAKELDGGAGMALPITIAVDLDDGAVPATVIAAAIPEAEPGSP